MRIFWRWIVGTSLAGVATAAFLACQNPAVNRERAFERVPLPPAEYVGMKTCLLCHEEKGPQLEGTRHWQAKDPRTPISTHGCESCHGPGSAHIEAMEEGTASTETKDGKWTLGLIAFGEEYPFPAEQLSAQCLACHQREKTHWQRTSHAGHGVTCVDCHKIHDPDPKNEHQLKAESQLVLCGKCHTDKRGEMERRSHHPVREGKMKCTSCHDPHGTGSLENLKAMGPNELCYSCHTEKRGPHLWEHAPVNEECTNCHTPHGSVHDKLLVMQIPFLCQRCHSDSGHPATIYDNSKSLVGDAPANRGGWGMGCLRCHSRIHGSNHPSGSTFTR